MFFELFLKKGEIQIILEETEQIGYRQSEFISSVLHVDNNNTA